MMYYDTHCHLDMERFADDREEVFARMQEADMIANTVGVDYASSRQAVSIAEKRENVYAVVGQHPVDNKTETFDSEAYKPLLAHEKVVAVGECGLDYFRTEPEDEKEKQRQRETLEAQVALAVECDMPLMLHCRPSNGTMDAYEETLDILERYNAEHGETLRGTAHFFVGDESIARRFFDIGFHVSFPGIITFVRDFDAVIRNAPQERILSETDAPFAAPEPHRGKRNEPAFVQHVVQKIADVRDEPVEQIRDQLVKNAKELFLLTE